MRANVRASQTAGVTKAGANHKLAVAASTSIRRALRCSDRQSRFRDPLQNGRGPPKFLLRVMNYFSHKSKEGRALVTSNASRQPNFPLLKIFSIQMLATFVHSDFKR